MLTPPWPRADPLGLERARGMAAKRNQKLSSEAELLLRDAGRLLNDYREQSVRRTRVFCLCIYPPEKNVPGFVFARVVTELHNKI